MKRILVIATRQIGDVLLTTPLIRAARQRWPEARIDVLGFEGQMGMLAGNPDVNECIPTPPRLGWAGGWRLARHLWRRYDLALVSQPGDRAHVLGWIAAPCRSGLIPEAGGSNWWKRRILQHAVVSAGDRGTVHVVPEKLRLLDPWRTDPSPAGSLGAGLAAASRSSSAASPSGVQACGPASSAKPQPVTVVPPSGRQLPDDLTRQLLPGYLVVHAPSMWAYKQWPVESWVALVQGLLEAGRQVVLTGSGGERDQACIAPLRALGSAPRLLDASGQLDLGQLRTLVGGAALYIGPDTSITHLAAACGTPCLAVFGPTNPQRWGPWPSADAQPAQADAADPLAGGTRYERHSGARRIGNVTLLQGPQDCIPCGRAGCEDHHHSRSDCLRAIPPATVLAQAKALLPPS